MKTLIFLSTLFIAFLALAGCSKDSRPGTDRADTLAVSTEYYTCPMHPSVRSDRPGACPVCGMALVKKTSLQEATVDEVNMLRRVSLSPTQRVIANVSTVRLQRRDIAKSISAAGFVTYSEQKRAQVAARFRGRIERVDADYEGLTVRQGENLFQLYSPDLVSGQQDYLLAFRSSGQPGGSSLLEASRERLKTHFGMTDTQIARLEKEASPRSTMTFVAPISGTVLYKQILAGQYVDEGTLLYEVADLSTMWVNFDVYEEDLRFLKIGDGVLFRTDAYPGEQFTGRITFIDPVMNPETRTIRVRTEASNPEMKLKPQMFVTGHFLAGRKAALAVPRTALLSLGKGSIVWTEVAPDAFEPRTVRVGMRTDDWIEILDGLREGEIVVSRGGYLLDSESELQAPSASVNVQSELVSAVAGAGIQEIAIKVKGAYSPDVIRVKKGIPLRLEFFREEEAACTREVVFKDFGIRKELPAWKSTSLEFTPDKAGTFIFTCGMNMVHGTLIVE